MLLNLLYVSSVFVCVCARKQILTTKCYDIVTILVPSSGQIEQDFIWDWYLKFSVLTAKCCIVSAWFYYYAVESILLLLIAMQLIG